MLLIFDIESGLKTLVHLYCLTEELLMIEQDVMTRFV